MAFNRNFTRASVGPANPATGARALCVEGRSEPADTATVIFVAVPHDGQLHSVQVDNPALIDWEANFPEGAPAFEVGEEVFVFGVAMQAPPCDPFTWQGCLEIEGDG
jgi:hypothetical protein